jgi:phospholipid/cholesterol/gamma-HCH transport system substrate-binding protein
MSPYKRNWFVGGTVLLALTTLGFLIILFGGSLGSLFAGEKIRVSFRTDRADGISDGSAIKYLGQTVGNVSRVQLILDKTPNYVIIDAELEKAFALPKNLLANIKIPNLLGAGAIIDLTVPPTGASTEKLADGDRLEAKYMGLGVLPPEFSDLAMEMKGAVKDFREANLMGDFKKTVNNFNDQVTKAGQVMESIQAVIGDSAVQGDIKTAVAKFREASDNAALVTANFKTISENLQSLPQNANDAVNDIRAATADARGTIKNTEARINEVSDGLKRNLDKLATVMEDMKSITAKIDHGDGTLALLLNDPKLYEKIVAGTETINLTVKDIQRVIRGFEEDGVPINMK